MDKPKQTGSIDGNMLSDSSYNDYWNDKGARMDVCFCDNVSFQTYGHVVGMKKPFKDGWDKEVVPIDVCIATEIAELWHKGVITLNSCCGHQKINSMVITPETEIPKMEKLGYTDYYIAPSGLPCFQLKTGTIGVSNDQAK